MRLENHIEIRENFYSSVNISYDIGNQYMIDNYIPTSYSVEIIEELLLSTDKSSKDKARILVGAYGKGKSHILLIVLSILSKIEGTDYTKLLESIGELNPDLKNYIENYLDSDKRFLPVIIEKNYSSLEQSFLYALNESLKINNLKDLMPDTFYISAINTIRMWEKDYPKTYELFKESVEVPIVEYINGLRNFNLDYYLKFTKIYPSLTSGSQFDPLLNLDVLEHYSEVSEKLKEYGYTGIFIVYDEFSKYLESSIDKISYNDLKLLQDFAELCNRKQDNQIHMVLVTHKNILNYINEDVNKEKIDGWKAISGRFKHLYIKSDTYKEMYQLIASAIMVDKKFINKLGDKYSKKFEIINSNPMLLDLFKSENISLEDLTYGCFPLHPLSTYILPRISIKLGQNERTLFSFLANKEHNSLMSLIEKTNIALVEPSHIFDFFEPSILESNYKLKAYKSYRIAKKIIEESNKSITEDILKNLIIIYFIDEYEKLAPTRSNIVEILKSLGYKSIDVEREIDELIKANNMIHQISNDYLLIKEDIGVDLEEQISDKTQKIKTRKKLEDIFNEIVVDKYLYPLRYNSNYEITRYFTIDFISLEHYLNIKATESNLDKCESDGKVYIVLTEDDNEISTVLESLKQRKFIDNRIIYIVNKNYNKNLEIIYRYYSVLKLMEESKDDRLLMEEYRLHLSDLENVVYTILNSFLLPELRESYYIYNGEIQNITRRSHLTSLLSDICEQNYPLTPVVNNETINKNYLSTAAYNSRSRLLDAILNNNLNEENLGLKGNRQEVSIMRSTLIQTGILQNVDGKTIFNLDVNDKNMNNFLKHIEDFILDKNNKGKRNFAQLYEIFFSREYGISMKTGTIPIYLAVVIRMYSKDLIISNNDEELDLSSNLLESINLNPGNYYIENLYWNKEKLEYLNKLWDIFSDYNYYSSEEFYKISQITDSMNSWYMSLSKYTRETQEIPSVKEGKIKFDSLKDEKLLFINSLKLPVSKPREYIFTKIPFMYEEENLEKVIKHIEKTVDTFNKLDFTLIVELKKYIKSKFQLKENKQSSLISVIKDWNESLDENLKNHVFPGINNSILNHFLNIGSDENKFIYDLAHIVVGLRLEDWDNTLVLKFIETIDSFKEEVEEFNSKIEEGIGTSDVYKVKFNKNEDAKIYKKVDYGPKTKLLYNQLKSSLDMMGQAISEEEKRQVILDILYELS